MKTYEKTFKNIERQKVWRLWTNVNDWPSWHEDLDYCKHEGNFEVGNHFFLKPKGFGPVKIMLTEINEGYSFTDCTSFWGAKMYDTHSLQETPEGLKIINTIIVTGPLKWLWIKLVVQKIVASIPKKIEALINRARALDE